MEFVIVGLATWRLSNMLVYEVGPFKVFTGIRRIMGFKHDAWGNPTGGPINSMFGCIWCLSVWVGLMFYVLPLVFSIPFALSTIAILINTGLEKWQ